MVKVLVGVGLALAVGACAGTASSPTVSGSRGASTRPAQVVQLDQSYTFAGGTFRYPSAWPLSPFKPTPSTMGMVIGYLSNERLHEPCSTTTTTTSGIVLSCRAPVGRLGPGGVLVTWERPEAPGQKLDQYSGDLTTIGDRPARVDMPRALGPRCLGLGADRELDVAVAVTTGRGHDDVWVMIACLSDPGSAEAQTTALAIARSLRFGPTGSRSGP